MAQKSQKHYFINLTLLVAGGFVFLGVLIPLIDPGAPPQFEEGASQQGQTAPVEPVSEEPVYYPRPQPQAHREPASISQSNKKINKVKVERPLVPRFLKKQNGDLHWQPNVIAVRDLKQTKSGKYLGTFGEFSIVDSQSESDSSFPVVWSQKSNQFGIYRGHVIVIGQSAELQHYLRKQGFRFSQLSGSYIIPVRKLGRAFDAVKSLKRQFPKALVEMDINMAKLQ